MKKIISIALVVFVLATLFCGCSISGEETENEVQLSPEVENLINGEMISIRYSDLVYHSVTHIVYINTITYRGRYVYTPFFSENGNLYRYNPADGTIEEIIK